MPTLKDLVRDKCVIFQYYRDNALWYKVEMTTFIFPVPVDDAGTATFQAVDKSILFMRWIRRHLAALEAEANASKV